MTHASLKIGRTKNYSSNHNTIKCSLVYMLNKINTFVDVSNIIVERSNTCRAAAIWARRRSSFKSFCLFPVTWANSTISAPNIEKAFTNSEKFATDSNLLKVLETFFSKKNKLNNRLLIIPLQYSLSLWLPVIVSLRLHRLIIKFSSLNKVGP